MYWLNLYASVIHARETIWDMQLLQFNFSLMSFHAEYLRGAVDEFTDACVDFHATIEKVVAKVDVYSNENVVRIINDKLMNIERAFIHDDGLPGRSYFK